MNINRDSSKHGPRRDEELKKETEALERGGHEPRVEEWREAEPSGEDQPEAGLAPEGNLIGGTPPGMGRKDVAGRSKLARWLQPSVFPAARERLLKSAAETHAPDDIRILLAELPEDHPYQNVQEVWRALGGGTEDVSRRA